MPVEALLDYRPALRARTGVGEYVHRTALALADTAPAGSRVTVFSSSWKDRLQAPGPAIAARDARLPVRLLNWSWHRLGWPPVEWLAGRADVVHSPTPLAIPSARAAQVVTIHDLFFLDHPDATEAEVRRDYAELVGKHARRADLVVTVSDTVAAQVVARLGVAPARVLTCHNGAPDWTPRAAVPADGPVIFVGTLEARKNVGGLLDAWERLVARGLRVPLLLAGGAPASAAPLLARLQSPALGGLVTHVGYLEEADRRAFYDRARLLVLPSFDEGFGLPVVEAMAAGVPVVAARRGALPEVGGDAAAYVDPTDPDDLATIVARLWASPEALAAMRTRGSEQVRRFSWHASARRLWDGYGEAVARRARR
ncbi:MAG TPA: glycosyltransferase family 1 protein [Luteitalea sp.]|nr:glycosyltransferase family 1 protein [Luteitalea sp.]